MPRYLDLEIHIEETKPPVWRRFLIAEDATFKDLHEAIQDAFGWTRKHHWGFYDSVGLNSAEIAAEDPDKNNNSASTMLSSHFAWKGGSRICGYLYDLEDQWWHRIRLRGYHKTDKRFERKLKGGKRAGPIEGTGGPSNYVRSVRVASGKLEDPQLKSVLGDWNPKTFSLRAAAKEFYQATETTPEKTTRTKTRKEADQTIAELLGQGLLTEEALDEALEGIHNGALQRALINIVLEGELPSAGEDVAIQIIDRIGVGRQIGKLQQAIEDDALSESVRALSRRLLGEEQATVVVAEDVTPISLLALAPGVALLDALDNAISENGFEDFEAQRQQQRLSALGLYRNALHDKRFQKVQTLMRRAIAAERSPLRSLALPRSRLPRVDAAATAPPSGLSLWVSDCDDQEQYELMLSFHNENDAATLLELRVNIQGQGILGGTVHNNITEDDVLDRVLSAQERFGAGLTAISPGAAATLLQEALERQPEPASDTAFAIAATMAQFVEPVAIPAPTPRDEFLPEASLQLLMENAPQWLIPFDRIMGLDIELPEPKDPAVWREVLVSALNTPEIRALYAAMATHTARLRAACGQELLAERYARIAAASQSSDDARMIFENIARMWFND